MSLRGNYQSWAKTYCTELHDHSLDTQTVKGWFMSPQRRKTPNTWDISRCFRRISPLVRSRQSSKGSSGLQQSLKGALESTQLISIIELCTEIESNTEYKTTSSNQQTKVQNRRTIKKIIFMQRRRKILP